MAESRISFTLSFEWPDGDSFETVSSLTIHEAHRAEDVLTELLEEHGFSHIAIEASAGQTPGSVGTAELFGDVLARAMEENGHTRLAAALSEIDGDDDES